MRHPQAGFWQAVRSVRRGFGLRCPRCGARTLFRNWVAMHERCRVCDLPFEREQGYFLGAMYVNYAFTVAIVLSGYFVLEWLTDLPLAYHLVLWASVSMLCPLLLFRYSRGVWLNFDYMFNPAEDPSPPDRQEWNGEGESKGEGLCAGPTEVA
jgi:uncharacterized protein (DUF983 family)